MCHFVRVYFFGLDIISPYPASLQLFPKQPLVRTLGVLGKAT